MSERVDTSPPSPLPVTAEPEPVGMTLPPGARQLVAAFALRPFEVAVLRLLLTSPRPLTLRKVRRRLGLTPEEVARLSPLSAPLRTRALCETREALVLGPLRDSDVLYPARGLAELWFGAAAERGALEAAEEAALFAGQLPGSCYLPAPPAGVSGSDALRAERPAQAIGELVREHLVAHQPRLLWLSGVSGAALYALAGAARARLLRPVVLLDAQALAGWPAPQRYAALLRLRRDLDLRGAVLVVAEAPALGGAVYALLGSRTPGHSAPLVLASGGAMPPAPLLPEPPAGESALSLREVDLRPAGAPAPASTAAAPASAAAAATPSEALVSASREEARRKAAHDAARAMGKPIPVDLSPPAPRPPEPRPAVESAPLPRPAEPRPAVESTPAPRAAEPRPASESATDAGAGGATVSAAADAPAPEAPVAAPAPVVEAAAAAAPSEVPEPPAVEPEPLPLSSEPTVNEVAQVARTTPNTAQRIALLNELAGKKTQAVILAFRQHLSSPNPAVRAAAEAGMTSIFGPDWNRGRPIPPPVQPPRSDDGGRGPHGAF